MAVNANSFAKTICTICYEDLKPVVEDLQAISICGHVFHELCLQQWFQYCSSEKKRSCPVCKQRCSGDNACRLYFQSVGDQNEVSVSQKVIACDDDPVLLRGEVGRLEAKVSGLNSVLERQGKEIKELCEEVSVCKDQLKKEVIIRNDAIEQKSSIRQLLLSKTQELDTVKLEYSKLQDRNMALATELAAIKLVSDLNLEEDEILKLASFGNEGNNKDTIDVLRKSLVIRNKSYKELMAKCNQLGRGEARCSEKLEKAKDKISKLKTRVQELEKVVEARDNEALRTLRASKKINCEGATLNGTSSNENGLASNVSSSKCQKEKHSVSVDCSCQTGSLTANRENFGFVNCKELNSTKECPSAIAVEKDRNACFVLDEAISEISTDVQIISDPYPRIPVSEDVKFTLARSEATSDINRELKVHRLDKTEVFVGSETGNNAHKVNSLAAASDAEVNLFHDDVRHVQPVLNIRKEHHLGHTPVPLSKPGDICFSSGLLGPDGTTRYLGKWCKRGQSKGSVDMQGTSASSGGLISVGSDGRGGRIKVLRSLNQSSLDGKENFVSSKRCKFGGKESNSQSQGCLQIEHFFGRANR